MPKPRVNGVLFPKNAPNGPVFSGKIEIDGVETNISVWEKVSAKGNNYLQISEDKRAAQATPGSQAPNQFQRPPVPRQHVAHRASDPPDDDIPF